MSEVTVLLPARHPGQEQIVLEAKRFNVLMCGRRFGKTALGKDIAVEALLDGKSVGWFSPTYKILDGAWRELVAVLDVMPGFTKNEQKLRAELPSGGLLECWSLDTDDPARSRAYDVIIVDEAGLVAGLSRIWNSALRSTLADRRGTAWFLGTPKMRGDLSALYAKGQSGDAEWMSWNKGMFDNPYIPPDEIESLRKSLPPDDYQREVLGLPTDDGGNPFGYDAIVACTRESMHDADHPDHQPVVWGWDLARAHDWTVGIALDFGGNVVRLERWQDIPWGETVKRIAFLTGTTEAWGDATGVGDPVIERLHDYGVPVNPYVFTSKGKQALMQRLAACIQMGEVTFPQGVIVSELDTFTYTINETGTKYSAPSGLHDDCVMALALALYGYDRVRPSVAPVALLADPTKDNVRWQALVQVEDDGLGERFGFAAQLAEDW